MTYAYVQDVAAGWEAYERVAAALGEETPDGLIVHAAGPTGGGFRIVEVWESEASWERFREERLRPAVRAVAGDAPATEPVFESLAVKRVIRA